MLCVPGSEPRPSVAASGYAARPAAALERSAHRWTKGEDNSAIGKNSCRLILGFDRMRLPLPWLPAVIIEALS